LINSIISGLNPTFNSFVTSISIATKDNPLSFLEFRDELLNHEMLLNQQQQAANTETQNFALFMQRHGGGPSRPPMQSFHNYNRKGKAPLLSRFPPRTGQHREASSLGGNGQARQFSPAGKSQSATSAPRQPIQQH
jgi:hypothetical protein